MLKGPGKGTACNLYFLPYFPLPATQRSGGGIFQLLYTGKLFLCTFYTGFKKTFHENFL